MRSPAAEGSSASCQALSPRRRRTCPQHSPRSSRLGNMGCLLRNRQVAAISDSVNSTHNVNIIRMFTYKEQLHYWYIAPILRLVVFGEIISSILIKLIKPMKCNGQYARSIAEKSHKLWIWALWRLAWEVACLFYCPRQEYPLSVARKTSYLQIAFAFCSFWFYLAIERRRRAATMTSYRTSLNAKRNAAVMALWVTLGMIPKKK